MGILSFVEPTPYSAHNFTKIGRQHAPDTV
jgi:hypothetical protein